MSKMKTKRIVKKIARIAAGALLGLRMLMPMHIPTASAAQAATTQQEPGSKVLVSYEDGGLRIKTEMHPSAEESARGGNVSFNGEFKLEPEKGMSFIDFGANISLKSKSPNLSNHINLGVLLNDESKSKATIFVKAGYGNKFSLSKNGRQLLKNHIQIRGGALFVNNGTRCAEKPTQLTLGLKDTISVPVLAGRTSLDALLGAELIRAFSEREWSTDSYAINAVLDHTSNLSKRVVWHNKASHNEITLNPDRYFFVDRKIEQKATTALGYNGNKFKIVGLITAENRKDDDSLMKRRAGLKIALSDWLLKSYIEKSTVNNKLKTSRYFVSLGKKFNKVALELFYSKKKSIKPWLSENDNFVGVVLGFDLGKSPNVAKFMEDDLHYYEKDNFYNITACKDYNLSFKGNIEQLSSIRKINEWISNITYKYGEWPTRTPEEVDSERGGDCDEQANWFSYIAKKHGYKAHILDYFTESGESGHGVVLVEDKKGDTFVFEYGEPYKINVDKNASLEEKAKAALNQSGRALALLPYENEELEFFVFKPSKGDYLDAWYSGRENYPHGFMRFKGEKPKTETGVRTLINDRFFK